MANEISDFSRSAILLFSDGAAQIPWLVELRESVIFIMK